MGRRDCRTHHRQETRPSIPRYTRDRSHPDGAERARGLASPRDSESDRARQLSHLFGVWLATDERSRSTEVRLRRLRHLWASRIQ